MSRFCSKCGKELGTLEDDFNGLCWDCSQAEKNKYNMTNTEIDNPVAQKFSLVVNVVKVIGYLSAIILGCSIWFENDSFLFGAGIGIGIVIVTWLSTLIFEAIAEGLNLLQEIVDKLRSFKN